MRLEQIKYLTELVQKNAFADLHEMCLFVQMAVGQKDGGVAAMYWSEFEEMISHAMEYHDTKNIVDVIPEAYIQHYIETELRSVNDE